MVHYDSSHTSTVEPFEGEHDKLNKKVQNEAIISPVHGNNGWPRINCSLSIFEISSLLRV
jgi:hypothetical protein